MRSSQPVTPVIVGPTAVGKTDIAVLVAEAVDAEIISSDSRQIFRQMSIGTAVPDRSILDRVPHHLIGELDIGDEYSAGIFANMARERIEDIKSRGKQVVVTGGSTLYLRALTEGLDAIPDVEDVVRQKLIDRLETEGPERLFAELEHVDPEFAETLDETKTQRIVRGLEVYHGTGTPLSQYFNEGKKSDTLYDITVLQRPRRILYSRINRRVDKMLDFGLLDEVAAARQYAHLKGATLPPTIGYQELEPVLSGDRSLEEGVRLVKRNSRRYAKRQLTWFRSLKAAEWIDLEESDVDQVVGRIVNRIHRYGETSQNA